MDENQLKAIIESLIFVSEIPLSLEQIKEILGEVSKKDLKRLLSELIEDYSRGQRGFNLIEVADGYQFRTKPELAEWINRLKKAKPLALSQPALETLAIIAYKQPMVRADIEKVRGVDCGGVLHTLLERKFIKILGKKDIPGKPLVYGTSKLFLEFFGLKDLSSLPTLKDLEALGTPPKEPLLPFNVEEAGGDRPTRAPEKLEDREEKERGLNHSSPEAAKDPF